MLKLVKQQCLTIITNLKIQNKKKMIKGRDYTTWCRFTDYLASNTLDLGCDDTIPGPTGSAAEIELTVIKREAGVSWRRRCSIVDSFSSQVVTGVHVGSERHQQFDQVHHVSSSCVVQGRLMELHWIHLGACRKLSLAVCFDSWVRYSWKRACIFQKIFKLLLSEIFPLNALLQKYYKKKKQQCLFTKILTWSLQIVHRTCGQIHT